MIERDAAFSPCGKYRYRLSRHWRHDRPEVAFILLNPSRADATVDDATSKRLIGFCERWKCGGYFLGNLFAAIATDPQDLLTIDDPVGPKNYYYLSWMCERAAKNGGLVVCGWGAGGSYLQQDQTFLGWCDQWVVKPQCLGTTKNGSPRHPLYVPYRQQLQPFG